MVGLGVPLKDRGLLLAILLVLVGGGILEFLLFRAAARKPVYTDGQTAIPGGSLQAERIVLWEEPVGAFPGDPTPDRESGPTVDPSGSLVVYAVGEPGTGTELWLAERTAGLRGATWRRRRLSEVSSPQDEVSPFLTRDGRSLYFASNRPGGHGGHDIYVSAREGLQFLPPLNLGPVLNSAGDDVDPCLSPTGDRLFFASDRDLHGRANLGLYAAGRRRGTWLEPRRLEAVRSTAVDRAPEISPDGKTLYFASSRPGGAGGLDLYRTVYFNDGWLPPAGITALNTAGDETDPALTGDGFTLYFTAHGGDLEVSHTRELFAWTTAGDRVLTRFGSLVLCLLILLLVVYLARRWAEMGTLGRCVVTSLIVHALLFLYFNQVMVQGSVGLARQQKGRYRVTLLPPRPRTPPGQRSFERQRGDRLEPSARAPNPGLIRPGVDAPRSRMTDRGLLRFEARARRPRLQAPGPARVLGHEERRALPLQALRDPGRRVRETPKTSPREAARMAPLRASTRKGVMTPMPGSAPKGAEVKAHDLLANRTAPRLPVGQRPDRPATPPARPMKPGTSPGALAVLAGPGSSRRPSREVVAARTPAEPGPPSPGIQARPAPQARHLEAVHEATAPPVLRLPERSLVRKGPDRSPPGLEPDGLEAPVPGAMGRASSDPLARASLPDLESRPPASVKAGFPEPETGEARPVALTGRRDRKSSVLPTPEQAAETSWTQASARTGPVGAEVLGAGAHPIPLRLDKDPGLEAPDIAPPGRRNVVPAGLLEGPETRPGIAGQRARPARPDEAVPLESGSIPVAGLEPAQSPDPSPVSAPEAFPGPPSLLSPRRAAGPEPFKNPLPWTAASVPRPPGTGASAALSGPARLEAGSPRRRIVPESPADEARALERPAVRDAPGIRRECTEEMEDPEAYQDLLGPDLLARADRIRPRVPAPQPPVVPGVRRESSLYDHRSGEARLRALREFGGSAESERAVRRGLAYLARVQRIDGSWGNPRYSHHKYGQVQIGKTGLSLLTFLGSGHTQKSATRYSTAVKRAIAYLVRSQNMETGHFGRGSAYSHGIAAYALAEAHAMTRDPDLHNPLKKAVGRILEAQYSDPQDPVRFGGWGYYYATARVWDEWPRASVTAWQVMALKSAQIGGIRVPRSALAAARTYLRRSFDPDHGYFRYSHDPDRLRSAYRTLPGSTPASVFALLLLGENPSSPRVLRGIRYVMQRIPERYARAKDDRFVVNAEGNLYFWYYSTLALFTLRSQDWKSWNERLRDLLVQAQDADGSWDPISPYANYAGDSRSDRSYTTALAVLMLEVYYRYVTPLLLVRPEIREAGEEEDPFDLPLAPRRYRVVALSETSAAARAGIRIGDEVVRYAGERVHDLDALKESIRRHRTRSRISLEVVRKGRLRRFTVPGGALGVTVEGIAR